MNKKIKIISQVILIILMTFEILNMLYFNINLGFAAFFLNQQMQSHMNFYIDELDEQKEFYQISIYNNLNEPIAMWDIKCEENNFNNCVNNFLYNYENIIQNGKINTKKCEHYINDTNFNPQNNNFCQNYNNKTNLQKYVKIAIYYANYQMYDKQIEELKLHNNNFFYYKNIYNQHIKEKLSLATDSGILIQFSDNNNFFNTLNSINDKLINCINNKNIIKISKNKISSITKFLYYNSLIKSNKDMTYIGDLQSSYLKVFKSDNQIKELDNLCY